MITTRLLFSLGAGVLATAGTANADAISDFYKGTRMTMFVGSGAGGGYDTYTRAFVRHYRKHIPGQPKMIVKNMQGAAGLRVTNYMYNKAKRDGSHVSSTFNTMMLEPLLGNKRAQFDVFKFNWLGSLGKLQAACVTWHTNSVKTLADAKKKSVTVSATGATSNMSKMPRIFNWAVGTKFKVIQGYSTSGSRLALERGEVDGICGLGYSTLLASNPDWILKKKLNFLAQIGLFQHPQMTKVPMIITYKKGLKRDGKNPTILYGYGGFNISLTPSFSIVNAVWLEQGGIYAVPNIRGGGEYGKNWHRAGTQMQKQNVFDDFIAAAEYLIENDYTSSDYLAVRGGSNGGLLVGAVMTQRPDLMRVALPAVGVLDMLRYHTFTAGAGWGYDYGTAQDSAEMFNYLLGYSPVHNVKPGVAYPATLVTTGDHDDRVVPAHSFKFAAELQAKQSGDAPVLIRIETDAGHGAGTPVSKTIEQYSDIFGFTLFHMGYRVLPEDVGERLKT